MQLIYVEHILILVCVYSVLTISSDLLAGHTGLLSVSHAAFYRLGAYASASNDRPSRCPFLGVLVGIGVAWLVLWLFLCPHCVCKTTTL